MPIESDNEKEVLATASNSFTNVITSTPTELNTNINKFFAIKNEPIIERTKKMQPSHRRRRSVDVLNVISEGRESFMENPKLDNIISQYNDSKIRTEKEIVFVRASGVTKAKDSAFGDEFF